tara:strand:+ start:769 stop:936 length:168 start_codon:yes stop_codon:yes gene_type:complete
MIFVFSFAIGFIIGFAKATRIKGMLLDKLQYGTGFGIAFTILALFIEILLLRLEF